MPLNNLLQQLLGLDPRTFAQANAAAQIGYERGIPPQDLERLYNGYLAQKDNGVAPVAQQPQNNLQSFINNRAIGGESNPDESGYARSLAAQPYKLSNSAQTDIMNAIQMAASGEGIPASMYSTLLSPSSQPNIDFTQLTVPQQNQGGWNTFRKVLGTLGTLGGTAADVISAAKGNAGPGGRASLAAGLNLLDDAAKQEEANRQANLLNELILNDQLPASNRAQIAAIARGVPQGIAQNLYPDPNEQLGKNLLNLSRAQDIYKNSPQGQADYEARLIDRQQKMEDQRAQRKSKEIEKLVNDIQNTNNNPNATEEQKRAAISKQAYLNSITKEQLTPAQANATINTIVKKDGVLDEVNSAYGALNRLNNLEAILQQLPEGRIEGNLEKTLYKFRGEPAVAEYKSLTTLLSSDIARKVLREVGNLNEQEQKRSLETVDLIGQTKEERLAKIKVIKDAMQRALIGSYGKIKLLGKTTGKEDLPNYLYETGALTFDPNILTSITASESKPTQSSQSVGKWIIDSSGNLTKSK